MTPKSNNQTSSPPTDKPTTSQTPAVAGDHPNLSCLYGSIGIQAVAAAARYPDVRAKPAVQRIDLRFVESAV
jgi:hypothetical protein